MTSISPNTDHDPDRRAWEEKTVEVFLQCFIDLYGPWPKDFDRYLVKDFIRNAIQDHDLYGEAWSNGVRDGSA